MPVAAAVSGSIVVASAAAAAAAAAAAVAAEEEQTPPPPPPLSPVLLEQHRHDSSQVTPAEPERAASQLQVCTVDRERDEQEHQNFRSSSEVAIAASAHRRHSLRQSSMPIDQPLVKTMRSFFKPLTVRRVDCAYGTDEPAVAVCRQNPQDEQWQI